MKELSPNDRPREKLLLHGARALGDNELLALVLGSGCHGRSALTVANDLLAARGGLHGLVQADCDDVGRVAGIGPARAAQIVAAVELGRRTLVHGPRARVQLQSPQQAAAFLMPAFAAASSSSAWCSDTAPGAERRAHGRTRTAPVSSRVMYFARRIGGAAAWWCSTITRQRSQPDPRCGMTRRLLPQAC
jgi:hypothetical protein